jgi:hypothetical protein
MEFERFLAVLRALERERVDYALVGATALVFTGSFARPKAWICSSAQRLTTSSG